jgi:two-component system CheB/CheR fusion protein
LAKSHKSPKITPHIWGLPRELPESQFFSNAPADGGLAYVVIQHLSPDYKSLMADLLAKRTDMPVQVAEDGLPVEPNHVYLIPPKQSITIFHHKLYLTERETGLLYLPIDIFFQSLAEDLGEKSIGVILSGTGSDGARGIRAIKEKGGLVIVQDEQSAKFDGMPRSAIATNLVDYILQPENMVREMLNYIQHPCLVSDPSIKRVIAHDDDSLSKIFALLRSSSSVDFTFYKQNTMLRRIERRMGIKQIERLSDYLHLLYQTPSEVNTLYREFLIGVTRFFRDTEAFEELKKVVIPSIFAGKNRGDAIRIWVAACSTGEEAYSIAILLIEYMETTGRHMDVKVFATDLDKNALEFAGKGIYPESIAADVSMDYLENYFVRTGESYSVARRVREMVIFAQQNIITDPPFSKVDLISCRNVLIYLQPVLQKKVISSFQFGLNPDGFLFLCSFR